MHPLRRAAHAVLPHVLPDPASSALLAMADRYGQYRRYKRSGSPAATRVIEARLGLDVRRGPFRGMRYPARIAYSRHSIPRLLGCYEEELHPVIERCVADPTYRRFVDVGSAEGYYSVGFALAGGRPVHAFEVEPFERRFMRMMAHANGVTSLVHANTWCSPEALMRLCTDRSFILCDCEGYEIALFTPAVVRALAHSDLIVELHDLGGVATRPLIAERFAGTHAIEFVGSRERRARDYPELAPLKLAEDRYVSEFRQPGQQWAIISSRAGSSQIHSYGENHRCNLLPTRG